MNFHSVTPRRQMLADYLGEARLRWRAENRWKLLTAYRLLAVCSARNEAEAISSVWLESPDENLFLASLLWISRSFSSRNRKQIDETWLLLAFPSYHDENPIPLHPRQQLNSRFRWRENLIAGRQVESLAPREHETRRRGRIKSFKFPPRHLNYQSHNWFLRC